MALLFNMNEGTYFGKEGQLVACPYLPRVMITMYLAEIWMSCPV